MPRLFRNVNNLFLNRIIAVQKGPSYESKKCVIYIYLFISARKNNINPTIYICIYMKVKIKFIKLDTVVLKLTNKFFKISLLLLFVIAVIIIIITFKQNFTLLL